MIRRVAAAILAVDGFTGQPVTDARLRVRSTDGAVPVTKEYGYRIFWDNGQRLRSFLIEVPGFHSELITVDTKELRNQRLPVKAVHLIPCETYPFPAEVFWIRGDGATTRLEEESAVAEEEFIPDFFERPRILMKKTAVSDVVWAGTQGVIGFEGMGAAAGLEPGEIKLSVPQGLVMTGRLLYLEPTDQAGGFITIQEEGRHTGIYNLTKLRSEPKCQEPKEPERPDLKPPDPKLPESERHRSKTAVTLIYRSAAARQADGFWIPAIKWKQTGH